MQNTPLASRRHVVIYGNMNAGKSSLFNRILEQDLAIVSSTAGTTTDPGANNAGTSTVPQTGDDAQLTLWAVLAMAAAAAVAIPAARRILVKRNG